MHATFNKPSTVSCGRLRLFTPALLLLSIAATLHAQSFSSGSTGADGDLIVNTAGVTNFTALPSGGGNVYNFKTIQIGAGATLRISGSSFPGPVYFLALGAVTVAGTIDLSGQNGIVPATSGQRTGPTIPGAGGYGGGSAVFGANPATLGLGPLGGAANSVVCYGASTSGGGGGNSATPFLVPLVGGSGGAGASGNGGAGGGAILIASSVSITVGGTITAAGGNGVYASAVASGGGAGGGIRLVAPLIAGSGTITAAGGQEAYCANPGAKGVVRLESFQFTFNGTTGGNVYTADPVSLFLPVAGSQPSIAVATINGIAVPTNPTGSFAVPDFLLNSTAPLTVMIHATNIPLGTVPTLYFSTQNFPDQVIIPSAGLDGTVASSSTTATVTLNPGYSIGFVTATWVR